MAAELQTLHAEELRVLTDDPLSLDERDDGPILVPQLPPQMFVRIARRLRDENRLELLLPYATPYQLTSLLDLDGWRRDRLDLVSSREWLSSIARTYAQADRPRGALVDLMYTMDPELWTLVLTPGTMVAPLDPDQDDARDLAADELGHLRTWESPDGFFLVGVPDDEPGRTALVTLSKIYDDDLDEGRRLCHAIHRTLPSQVEEDCLRWRTGRLADLGFVEWEEAMRLFVPLDHRAALDKPAMDFAYLPESEALDRPVEWTGPDLLRRVMGKLEPNQHGVRSREFLLLVNEVMSAQRFEAGDEELQERAIGQTQATLTLGLELLRSEATTRSDLDAEALLAERVGALGLRQVFRVGYGALHKLRAAAVTLHREGRVSLESPGSLLDRPWGPGIAALGEWYPELPLQSTSGKTRPLAGLTDVARATRLVAEAGALAQLVFAPGGYGIDPAWIGRVDEPKRLKLGDLLRTAIVHAQLPGTTSSMAPLTQDDVAWAAENLLGPDGLVASVRRDLEARCEDLELGAYAEVLAQNVLTRLAAELASLERDDDGKPNLTRLGGLVTVQTVGMWLETTVGVN